MYRVVRTGFLGLWKENIYLGDFWEPGCGFILINTMKTIIFRGQEHGNTYLKSFCGLRLIIRNKNLRLLKKLLLLLFGSSLL